MTQTRPPLILLAAMLALTGCAAAPGAGGGRSGAASSARQGSSRGQSAPSAIARAENAAAVAQVTNSERAFAQTMADRDLKAFVTFLSPNAVFFSGNTVEHGVAEIVNVWSPFFAGPRPPFSWRPDHVEVTADGRLALSTGPILQQGKTVARYTSIWRLEGKTWHIVFDKGEPVCGPSAS
jgi:ketosteroid isomerase-like protein